MSAVYWNPVFIFLGRSASNSLQQVLPWVCLPSRRILPAWRTDPQRECSVQFLSRDNPYLLLAPRLFQPGVQGKDRSLHLYPVRQWNLAGVWLAGFAERERVTEQLCVLHSLMGEISPLAPSLCWFCGWLRQCSNITRGAKHSELDILAVLRGGFSLGSHLCCRRLIAALPPGFCIL